MSKRQRYDMVSERGCDHGGGPKQGFTAFTTELAQWLPAKTELVERTAARRPGVFLEAFDVESTGGREVLATCTEVAEWTEDECKAFYEEKDLPTSERWQSYDLEEKRWKTMIARLKSFLPQSAVEESAEAQLVAMVPGNHESVMQFAGRFQSKATKLIGQNKIEEARVSLILMAKLPEALQKRIRGLCGKERKLAPIVEGVVDDQNWESEITAISKTLPKSNAVTYDAMQICDWDEGEDEQTIALNSIRAELFDGDRIRYDQVKTANHVMVLAKHLIKKHPRYRREMARFLKIGGAEDAIARPRDGPSGVEPQIQYLSVPDEEGETFEDETLHLNALRPSPKPRPLIRCSVEMAKKKLDAIIDTGASCSFVQESLLQALGLIEDVVYAPGTAELGDGSIGRTEGLISLTVRVGDKEHAVDAFVLRGKGSPLILGLDYVDDADVLIYPRKRVLVDAKDGTTLASDASVIQCHTLATEAKNEIPAPPAPGQC